MNKTGCIDHEMAPFLFAGEMSCNPAFGGVGKGHLMKEVDALDGLCAVVAGIECHHLSQVMKKLVFGVCDQVRLKLACSATETS